MKKTKAYTVKQLKEFADDIAVSKYGSFYRSVSAKNKKWLAKNYGRP
jgi:hypothetical protein